MDKEQLLAVFIGNPYREKYKPPAGRRGQTVLIAVLFRGDRFQLFQCGKSERSRPITNTSWYCPFRYSSSRSMPSTRKPHFW